MSALTEKNSNLVGTSWMMLYDTAETEGVDAIEIMVAKSLQILAEKLSYPDWNDSEFATAFPSLNEYLDRLKEAYS